MPKQIVEMEIETVKMELPDTKTLHLKWPEEGYDPEVYRIVGPAEANPGAGYISHESPLGKSLIGHKPGDRIKVSAPEGAYEVVILKVE